MVWNKFQNGSLCAAWDDEEIGTPMYIFEK